jgi:hypothetical protein
MALGSVLLLTTASSWGSTATAAMARHSAGAFGPGLVHGPNQTTGGTLLQAKSPNWAGYALWGKGVTFSDVVGSWTQPAATCPTNAQQDASFWVGIDGYQKGSPTTEQIGTDSDCAKKNKKLHTGGPTYYAWWQMYPSASNTIPDPVSPGDQMTAEVSANGTSFTLTLTDNSQNPPWSYSTVQSSSSARQASAEWIAEAPSGCNGCASVKLADFTSVSFNGLSVTFSPSASAFNIEQIQMFKGKTQKASAGSEMSNGSSFTVQWLHN